ncbi:MAG: hypothetical protein RQ745_10530 [Longimicrobiales bacterium]|nr:hypothetical protein [Longimicrobiales bacterium]
MRRSLPFSLAAAGLTAALTAGLPALAVLPISVPIRTEASAQEADPALFQSMRYRNIGPHRGGRVTTVTGIPDEPFTFYMGATGGGVWKTTDAGTTWENVSDGYFNTTGIGDIVVAPSDPNVIYVGTGESPVRGVKTSHGDGVYKSTDAGETWRHIGLEATRHVGALWVHPADPDVVYVGAQGNPWGPNEERGMYRSTDGGETWDKILHINEDSGIVDLSVSAANPRVMIATSWDFRRRPWVVKSGGPGSKVWKTTDGGESWREITRGLPELMGKIGVAISPADPEVVYLAVEAVPGEGGVYRSDDGGESFRQVNGEAVTYARAWYYMHVVADPVDADEVWVLNSPLLKSIDGGRTFTRIPDSHVDHHDLWINPHNTEIVINGNDGGAAVSVNGGESWSSLMNQPTAQMYRVMTDNLFPYNVYSGQQDASGIVIASRTLGNGIGEHHWQTIRSGESATVGLDPENPRYVYSTFFASFLGEWDAETWNYRMVRPYPERVTGEQPKNLKYRANWNGPVYVSTHDPNVIYYGSQYLMKSTDRGNTWEVLSEDLTRDEEEKQGMGGYPISNEQITAESYNNVFNIEESLLQEGLLWIGSDDGLVHMTRDGGRTIVNVTPEGLPESIVNVVEPSPHDPARAYFVAAGYKMNDFTPYVFRTDDYGETWTKIIDGIPGNTFARSIREDPDREGLLYLGTETGIFVSFDDGAHWQPFQLNLPEVPVTDLRVRRQDLVVATQGRSLWILDDLTPLHQISDAVAAAEVHLYDPRDPYREITPGYYAEGGPGENPPRGMQVNYVVGSPVPAEVPMAIEVLDASGEVIFGEYAPETRPDCPAAPRRQLLRRTAGAHRWSWDMNVGRFACIDEVTNTSRNLSAYAAAPGRYRLRLTVGDDVRTQDFEILIDPRLDGIAADPVAEYEELDRLSASLFAGAREMEAGVLELRRVREQMALRLEAARENGAGRVVEGGESLTERMEEWESRILQKYLETGQNNYMFEARLLVKFKDLLGRMSGANIPVTTGVREVTGDYLDEWVGHRNDLDRLREELRAFNQVLRSAGLPELYLGAPRPVM